MPDAGVAWCPADGQVQQLARPPARALSMAGRNCADMSTSRQARSGPQMSVKERTQDPGFAQGATLAQKRTICACP